MIHMKERDKTGRPEEEMIDDSYPLPPQIILEDFHSDIHTDNCT